MAQLSLNLEPEQEYIAALGHALKAGDKVEWTSCGHQLIGEIIGFKSGKCEIQTTGCRYLDQAELDEIRAKAKRKYKVNPEKCFKLEQRTK